MDLFAQQVVPALAAEPGAAPTGSALPGLRPDGRDSWSNGAVTSSPPGAAPGRPAGDDPAVRAGRDEPAPGGRVVVDRLTKVFRGGSAPSTSSASRVEPGSVTGFLGPERRGQDHHAADGAGPGPPDRRARRPSAGGPTGACPTRCPRRRGARVVELPPGPHRPQPPAHHVHGRRAARCSAPTRCSTWSGWATPAGARCAATRSACGSASAWPPRCSATPGCWCWTSRPTAWTRTASAGCAGFFRHLADEGRTVLVSSHQLAEVQEVADRVVILNRGRLVRSGSIANSPRAPTPSGCARRPRRRSAHAIAAQGGQRPAQPTRSPWRCTA